MRKSAYSGVKNSNNATNKPPPSVNSNRRPSSSLFDEVVRTTSQQRSSSIGIAEPGDAAKGSWSQNAEQMLVSKSKDENVLYSWSGDGIEIGEASKQSTNSQHRPNSGDAFSSSSESSDEDESSYINPNSEIHDSPFTNPPKSAINRFSRYNSPRVLAASPFAVGQLRRSPLMGPEVVASSSATESKYVAANVQRKIGRASTSAFDRALEDVKMSSTSHEDTKSDSNTETHPDDKANETSSKVPSIRKEVMLLSQRSDSGTMIGALRLSDAEKTKRTLDSDFRRLSRNTNSNECEAASITSLPSSTSGSNSSGMLRYSRPQMLPTLHSKDIAESDELPSGDQAQFLTQADNSALAEAMSQDDIQAASFSDKSPIPDFDPPTHDKAEDAFKHPAEEEFNLSYDVSYDDVPSPTTSTPSSPNETRQSHDIAAHFMPALDVLASSSIHKRLESKAPAPSPPHPPPTSGRPPSNELSQAHSNPPPPPSNPPRNRTSSFSSVASSGMGTKPRQPPPQTHKSSKSGDLSSGVLPDVLMTMREKIESLSLFDSDMMRLAQSGGTSLMTNGMSGVSAFGGGQGFGDDLDDEDERMAKESLQRSFQQSISAAVLVSLAHKRYERRRLAAMEIEKIVRSLVTKRELDRVRAILLLLSDDYVRSTSEDARKGGVVALAACQIGLKKADDRNEAVAACKDLILASVVHACQDPSSRVRYYATESLFNVVKVVPPLAVQHFFILFEILRSLYADVDHDVRSGAQLLDKKLKEIIVGAINGGTFNVEQCTPLFVRFVYMKNKPTKRLTLTWLQEFSEKLVGNPLLEFVHLFLGGVFSMIADPSSSIRQLALGFLQTILPKLLNSEDSALFEDGTASFHKVDFDKILQSLVTIMEHPDPFVRKVAMYWMSQIITAHVGMPSDKSKNIQETRENDDSPQTDSEKQAVTTLSAASISVRNSLPYVLPGILLSIGDAYHSRATNRDNYFLSTQTTQSLADQTNKCLQRVVSRDGEAFISHLDGFIVTLLEELDTPGGLGSRNVLTVERKPYRVDVKPDGSGIESTGWFRAIHGDDVVIEENAEEKKLKEQNTISEDTMMIMSRLCALEWISVLYENVVPKSLKAEYANEFVSPILHQLVHNPPNVIVFKSFEVLAKITTPSRGEPRRRLIEQPAPCSNHTSLAERVINHNLDAFNKARLKRVSRDRKVFSVLIRLFSRHHRLLCNVTRILQIMCTLQPAEFIFVSFAVELDSFISRRLTRYENKTNDSQISETVKRKKCPAAKDLEFVSCFVQQMTTVLLTAKEAEEIRTVLKDSVGPDPRDLNQISSDRRQNLFRVLFYSFAHNYMAAISLCFWGGAYLTAAIALHDINPMEINLIFYLEVDQFIELVERPIFRHLHFRMLENEDEANDEGNSAVLFRAMKSVLMLLPQSTCYFVLKDRLSTVAKFRQVSHSDKKNTRYVALKSSLTIELVKRFKETRETHCRAKWGGVRAESLETPKEEANLDAEDESISSSDAAEDRDDMRNGNKLRTGSLADRVQVSSNSTLLRLPDGVVPKDQKHNVQRFGLKSILQSQLKTSTADFPKNHMRRASSLSLDFVEESGDDPNRWKDVWSQGEKDQ